MSPLQFRNGRADLVTGVDLMDTTADLALIIKDLQLQFPGIMAPGVFRHVDNIINEAVAMGTVARPGPDQYPLPQLHPLRERAGPLQ
jgi:hypothetical protein